MAVSNHILGMNARNFLYIRKYNFPSSKRIADNKLSTKKLLIKNNIPTPKLIKTFTDLNQVRNYDWSDLPATGFVIKPARGYGGIGILPIKRNYKNHCITTNNESHDHVQIESHILDILEGGYSLQSLPDKAYIEELLKPDLFFKKLGAIGLPDIRIIVFNNIPIMAMMRLPTPESQGKANIHLGAIALGIDLRTGITTHGIHHNKLISYLPNTKIKTKGIKIPYWDQILLLSAQTQNCFKRLGYAGIDIVIDNQNGIQVLEINARPGLSIQIANQESLRNRLERVENIPRPSPERGVEIAKSLFAQSFSDKLNNPTNILQIIEDIKLKNGRKTYITKAKIDSGAYRTSIDKKLAKNLGYKLSNRKVHVLSASGEKIRPTTEITFELAGKKIKTLASVIDRSHLRYPIIVGRIDLKGFLINPDSVDDEKYKDSYSEEF